MSKCRVYFDYTWIVDYGANFGAGRRRDGEYVAKSPRFSAVDNPLKWFLELRTDTDGIPKNNIKLFLEIANKAELKICGGIYGQFECSLMNSQGQRFNNDSGRFRFDSNSTQIFTQIEKFPSDVSSLKETGCIQDGKLRIYCRVAYIRESEFNLLDNDLLMDNSNTSTENFQPFLNSEEFSDVAVYVGQKKFPCHKIILSRKSSVFRAMLNHDMQEKNSNRIDIRDIDADVFLQVLRYIYTGTVDISETTVFELIRAADMYDLEALKTMCEDKLCEMLAAENASKMLSISNTFNLKVLKGRTVEFIKTNLKKILSTDEWHDLKLHPDFGTILKEMLP